MRIVVTGSSGQLGSELLPLLVDNHDVLGLDLHNCDLTDRESVLATVTTFHPDLIIHGAAFTAVDRCETEQDTAYRVNCLATRFLADSARRCGAHVVYVSTDYVFDGTSGEPYREWDVANPRSVYGQTKLGGEHELDPQWTIARTSWVCSRFGNNMVKTVLRVAEQHEYLSFVDDQRGQPTFAGDLAKKLIQLGVSRVPGVHHVTNQGAVSWYEFVGEILEAAGYSRDKVRPISSAEFLANRPVDAPRLAPRPANSVLDNFSLRHSGLGELRDFREPLAEVVRALQA